MEIGIIGLGVMGRAMARNLARAGHEVKAWNRSGGSVEGVTMVASPVEAVQGDAVLTMLSDDDAIRSTLVASGVLARARRGLVHVVTSTISVAFARELVAVHQKAGIGYVSAPVLGRPDVAAKGELNVLAAGAPEAVATIRPLLEVIGGRIWHMGDEAPTANAAKIACNMMITMAIEAMAEAVVLTEANGLQRERFFDVILNTLFGSRSYQVYSANISGENYEPGFKATLGLKDLRLASEAAREAGRTLPMLAAVHGRMADTVAAGLGDRDWSAMAKYTIQEGTGRGGSSIGKE
ncbi:3-hydroxyisobutyrate dehydrogenase-like beta-hydroxyacid dehydrogenase [Paraburkholderia sp. BL18I3N2]|uniref:NAD(P)-dependent oxidoreductase n=1 Tax=Paraburkholderia sp. BL18I3N2 TaxID=1938799 RepID=UPI000D078460|nr:NAD(P)-dependent oxidoreductase [Paraburkholderia sp. BL18I3N2]PRX24113.1 3-hydroxyisobutyrate dehydrogenase-like beta-hydroxyacid dehydrogenase [Paraburkholderia sp. BL18I3N2]